MDPTKRYYSTPTPFEREFCFRRAVRKGPFIYVSGTTALKFEDDPSTTSLDGSSKVLYPKDAKKQAKIVMERCLQSVEKLGGKLADVVRVRMFVANYEDCSMVGAAFKDIFGFRSEDAEIGAAATMIVVQKGFVDPDILVEVEVDAVMGSV